MLSLFLPSLLLFRGLYPLPYAVSSTGPPGTARTRLLACLSPLAFFPFSSPYSVLALLVAIASGLQIEPLENAHSQGDVKITWTNEGDDSSHFATFSVFLHHHTFRSNFASLNRPQTVAQTSTPCYSRSMAISSALWVWATSATNLLSPRPSPMLNPSEVH
ncbi:hypothetical protein AB1N83_014182 [Pleurotus pulmonarius]